MSSISDSSAFARGDRVKRVREAGGWDQATFAKLLNESAGRLGLAEASFDAPKISRLENGKRDLSLDDAILVTDLDPERRDVRWLAGARPIPTARKARAVRHAGHAKGRQTTGEA